MLLAQQQALWRLQVLHQSSWTAATSRAADELRRAHMPRPAAPPHPLPQLRCCGAELAAGSGREFKASRRRACNTIAAAQAAVTGAWTPCFSR